MAYRCSLAGLYRDLPVSVLVDPDSEFSYVSLGFLVHHDLPRSVRALPTGFVTETVSGPVVVRTRSGQYESVFLMYVGTVPRFDIILGRDWMRGCAFQTYLSVVLDPDPDTVMAFGHHWMSDIVCGQEFTVPTCAVQVEVPLVSDDRPSTYVLTGTNATGEGSSVSRIPIMDVADTGGHCAAALNVTDDNSSGRFKMNSDVTEENADPLQHSTTFFELTIAQLYCRLQAHGLEIGRSAGREQCRLALIKHLSSGQCACNENAPACIIIRRRYDVADNHPDGRQILRERYLHAAKNLKKRPLLRLLKLEEVPCDPDASRGQLRAALVAHIRRLQKAKWNARRNSDYRNDADTKAAAKQKRQQSIIESWPGPIPATLKEKLLSMFRKETSSEKLRTFTCACCSEEVLSSRREIIAVDDLPLELLRCHEDIWYSPSPIELPFGEGPLEGVLLDPEGVSSDRKKVQMCKTCWSALSRKHLPPLALANRMYLGPIPDELKDLTDIEEAMIAQCRAKCCIVRLTDDSVEGSRALDNMQQGLRGNIIEYPQQPGNLLTVLPPPIEDIVTLVCVIFVGNKPPTREWLLEKAKPLAVRKEHVRRALLWLKTHNPLYHEIKIDHGIIDSIPADGLLPYHVESVSNSVEAETLVSRYDSCSEIDPAIEDGSSGRDVIFQSVVISDTDGHVPQHKLRAAAIRHFHEKDGGYIQISHGSDPVNEFNNPTLFPRMYPTLFPYGIGGFEDKLRSRPVSFRRHARHLFQLADRRFQEHRSFLFVVFNILQRREVLLRSSLKVRKESFSQVAADLQNITPDAMRRVCERVARDQFDVAYTEEERRVVKLMRQVNLIRGMMLQLGLPSFYITINPADTHNPVVQFLAGKDIDLDSMSREDIPNTFDQGVAIAKNPFLAARFFNLYMNAFFKVLLGYDHQKRTYADEGGVLGHVTGYYGCVETQGRGSMHCHMVVWLEGALNPNQIRDRVLVDGDIEFARRLISYLDDSISNYMPEIGERHQQMSKNRIHPSKTRGVDPDLPEDIRRLAEREDLYLLVKKCQWHKHSLTCYKYVKPGEELKCRFDMDADNVHPQSSFDMENGDLCLRCLNRLVNNFNETMLKAIRCNMDIKFVGSGEAAKAILYYITNYITKTQLKAHVAYTALELAIKRLAVQDIEEDTESLAAKRMLQKCAFALLTHQEMSAPQVASYLLGHEERYPSHEFRNLYWTSFEAYINNVQPSPECYPASFDSISDTEGQDQYDHRDDTQDVVGPMRSSIDMNGLDEHEDDIDEDDNDVDENNANLNGSCEIPIDPDVILERDKSGNVIAKADQVSDYLYRPLQLTNLSVWQYFRHTSKERLKSSEQDRDSSDDQDDGMEFGDGSDQMTLTADELGELVSDGRRRRQSYRLLSDHPEYSRKKIKIINPTSVPILVPIGPSLPRRDRSIFYEKYCRLMAHLRRHRLLGQVEEAIAHPTALADDLGEEEILQYVQECSRTGSLSSGGVTKTTAACVSSALAYGIFERNNSGETNDPSIIEGMSCELSNSADLEKEWNTFYLRRRNELKRKTGDKPESSTGTVASPDVCLPSADHDLIQNLDRARNRRPVSSDDEVPVPHIICGTHSEFDAAAEIENVINEWTLNAEQAYAFRIIATHASRPRHEVEQLRMFLNGPGGTGKSRVINALSDFFRRRGEERRFRLASYTGIAARNVGGITLHTSLSISSGPRTARIGSKTHQDLTAMWEGVDYLFIDEVSMLGCLTLAKVTEALSLATGKHGPFGGMNIIFAGDFAQLPPVTDIRLFGFTKPKVSSDSQASVTRASRTIYGKLLWLSVDTVVVLTQVMRQAGAENQRFVELLSRLRTGSCIEDDQRLLNSRLLNHVSANGQISAWKNAPVIVYDNATKDALNCKAVEAFACQTGRPLHWYHCRDRHLGQNIQNQQLREFLVQQHSGQTGGLMGRIPLVLGMKVIISKNFDLEGGVLNGSIRILRKIRFKLNEYGERQLVSCVVYLPDSSTPDIAGLHAKEVPVLEETKEWKILDKYSKKMLKLSRTQVAIQPAYAFTCHRVQGQTFNRILIDLEGCSGAESPYVMLSRARSLEGIAILRPFSMKKISTAPNRSLTAETTRIRMLGERTKLRLGGGVTGRVLTRLDMNGGTQDHGLSLTVETGDLPSSTSIEKENLDAELQKRIEPIQRVYHNLSLLRDAVRVSNRTGFDRPRINLAARCATKRPAESVDGNPSQNKRRRFHDMLE
ncbi:hypothetical protein NM688_g18 [Phlebia brevispora]|uniref:Uncharacterized protein n=1 Tax=Phlebia brevispora TaxID=194682 RepID=A0ACC1TFV7_9APHY|nr:hypothetical protein NM688_g18 [Phlebia brevispora]